jgi:hypothetical protein
MMRLLRPPHSGIFLRSFRLHSHGYARERNDRENLPGRAGSLRVALATAIMSQPGSSWPKTARGCACRAQWQSYV